MSEKRKDYIHAMESSDQMDAVTTITDLIEKLRKHQILFGVAYLCGLKFTILCFDTNFCILPQSLTIAP